MKTKLLAASIVGSLVLAFAPSASAGNTCGAKLGPLQGLVDKSCKPANKITCPKGGVKKTCAQYTALFNAGKACKAARQSVNACFKPGPDAGHKMAVAVVGQAISDCQTMMQKQCGAEKRAQDPK